MSWTAVWLSGRTLCLACTRPWLPSPALVGGKACLHVFKITAWCSEEPNMFVTILSGGKNTSPTQQLGPCADKCGLSVAGIPFPAGLWVLCDWGIFCIPEGTQKPHLRRRDPFSAQHWDKRPDRLCSNCPRCLNLSLPY